MYLIVKRSGLIIERNYLFYLWFLKYGKINLPRSSRVLNIILFVQHLGGKENNISKFHLQIPSITSRTKYLLQIQHIKTIVISSVLPRIQCSNFAVMFIQSSVTTGKNLTFFQTLELYTMFNAIIQGLNQILGSIRLMSFKLLQCGLFSISNELVKFHSKLSLRTSRTNMSISTQTKTRSNKNMQLYRVSVHEIFM